MSGDILIGEETTIDLGYVFPLNDYLEETRPATPEGSVVVENDKGQEFRGVPVKKGKAGRYLIDTSNAPENARYRLVIKLNDGREFNTPWSGVNQAPEITDLSYDVDKNNLKLYCSLDGRDSIWNFSWEYDEVWEYHAYFIPDLLYVDGEYVLTPKYDAFYYCWDSRSSVEPCLASADGLTVNKIERNNFHTMSRSDNRISYLYSIKVTVRGLSSSARAYMENMKNLSNGTGDLFTPTPSEMRGNISCVSDPDEQVVGYVSVCKRSSHRIFISAMRIYKMPIVPESLLFYPEPDEDGNYDLPYLFRTNSPVSCDDDEPNEKNVRWGPKRCTDCRAWGGTKTKPDWWPNDDK